MSAENPDFVDSRPPLESSVEKLDTEYREDLAKVLAIERGMQELFTKESSNIQGFSVLNIDDDRSVPDISYASGRGFAISGNPSTALEVVTTVRRTTWDNRVFGVEALLESFAPDRISIGSEEWNTARKYIKTVVNQDMDSSTEALLPLVRENIYTTINALLDRAEKYEYRQLYALSDVEKAQKLAKYSGTELDVSRITRIREQYYRESEIT
ncbi:MAG TPA: hypothetical protein PLD54_00415 [Candidatus Levybacteria bacterium]|nr:hypothetical protein [Candidatus Levybacteria bacterium]